LHIRDLLTGGSMGTASTFNYVKEVAGEGSIATVAEGASKAQIDLDLVEAQVPAQWIAGYLRISRNMLDDVIGMSTFLNSRLPELLLRTEDNQLLNGNGTSPNISGITHSGNFTAPTSGGSTIDVEQLVEAIAQLEGYDREANGILIHPSDYYRILLNKAGGSGEYDLPGLVQVVNGQLFVGGVPVYRSTAATVDKFIVGDWAMGASLITREPVRIEIFEQDGTNVRENKLTVRIEERIAFPIYGDNYFIYGDFGNVS
jgi:HK97 family phage major capsid protein